MIRVVLGELSDTAAEAVLRPVSAQWNAVTAPMRRLELHAGPELEAQCLALGDLPVGSAVITGAGDLAAKFMIHVVVRSVDEPVTESGVRRGMNNGLRRIAEWDIRRVAMAPLGTGAGNLDADESAAIMIPALVEQMRAGPPTEVEIRVDSEYEREVFERHIRAAEP
ncbi:ADP-ribose-binding protein [soil metagenome]